MSEEQTSDAKIDWANQDLGVAWGESVNTKVWHIDYTKTLPLQHEAFLQQFVLNRIRAAGLVSTDKAYATAENAEKAWQRIQGFLAAERRRNNER